MKNLFVTAMLGMAVLVSGCASGPKYAEVSQSFSELKPGEGRIFFFRSNSIAGVAAQSAIWLDGIFVGASRPGGFFYVDRPAGSYTAKTRVNWEKKLDFTLEAGETKYIRTSPSLGIFVGNVALEVEDPEKAQAEIEELSFTGKLAANDEAPPAGDTSAGEAQAEK